MAKDNQASYYKAEYENLRRKYIKEKEQRDLAVARGVTKTLELLHLLGMKDKEIIEWYREK